MISIERAYQRLGLSPDASLAEAREAYEELTRVWDPTRFGDEPELAQKARRRLESIEEAYRVIARSEKKAPPVSPPLHPWLEEKERKWRARRAKREAEEATPPGEAGRPHSLFDDAFSERLSEPKRKIPVWLIIAASLFLLVVAGVFLMDGGGEVPPHEETKDPTSEDGLADGAPSSPELARGEPGSDLQDGTGPPALSPPGGGRQEATPKQSGAQPPSPPLTRPEPDEREADGAVARAGGAGTRTPPATPAAPPEPKADRTPPPEEPARTPRLTRTPSPPEEAPVPKQEATPTEDEGLTGPEAEEAFAVLRQESQSARELLADKISSVRYVDWKALPKEGGEFWVDLTAEIVASGEELHFIWAVDPKQRRVRPMSQAARDLELGRTRM